MFIHSRHSCCFGPYGVCLLVYVKSYLWISPQTMLLVGQKSKPCSVISNCNCIVTSQYCRALRYPQSHFASLPHSHLSVARLCSHTGNWSCVVLWFPHHPCLVTKHQCQTLCPPSLKPLPPLTDFFQFGLGLYFLV